MAHSRTVILNFKNTRKIGLFFEKHCPKGFLVTKMSLNIVPICDTWQTTAECMKESQVNKLHWNQQNLKQNNTICIQI
jgi:hypothetical protein